MSQITYQDKSNINTSTAPPQNKISDTDMNEIKSVVNGNDTLMGDLTNLTTTDKTSIVNAINELANKNVYSTTEVVVGKWVDNKPIYRKVIATGTMSANAEKIISMDIPTTSISQITRLDSYYNIGIGTLPQNFNTTGYETKAFYSVSSTTGQIVAQCGTNVESGFIIVEYTKN